MAHEGSSFAKPNGIAVGAIGKIGELTTQGRVGKKITDASLDIDPAIGFGGSSVVTIL